MTVLHQKNPNQCFYGNSIGILVLDVKYPCVPGNVANATTYSFPVRYKVVKGASTERLLWEKDKSLIKLFIDAALELQNEGVGAITGACGFMAFFQKEVAERLEIPVFLSSLLQVPFVYQILGGKKRIGVISADASALTPDFFKAAGVSEETPLAIAGMEHQEEFSSAILKRKGTLDSQLIEQEVVQVARELMAEHADLGAIILECSDLPPYAHAVQREVDLPVFDFITMINYVHSALVRHPYMGFL
jgi:aspartate/glutamate racemase